MSADKRSDWLVVAGCVLIVMGAWGVFNGILGPLFAPVRQLVSLVNRVGWPLAVIGVGVLFIVAAQRGWRPTSTGRRLYRSRTERMIGGVLGGFADYLGADPTVVRVVYVLLTVLTGFGTGLVVYVIAMIVIPEEPISADGGPPSAPPAPPVPPAPVAPPPPPPTTPGS